MGTILTAAIQVKYPAQEYNPDPKWQTECIFEMGKNYKFMIWLSNNGERVTSQRFGKGKYQIYKPDNDWPDECHDSYNYTIIDQLIPETCSDWISYHMLRAAQQSAIESKLPVRILTWTDS